MAKTKLGPISSQFVLPEKSRHKYSLGSYVATALSGFLAGIIITCSVWYLVIQAFFK